MIEKLPATVQDGNYKSIMLVHYNLVQQWKPTMQVYS